MNAIICIDYDNLQDLQKQSGLLNIITKILIQLPITPNELSGRCHVRLYGGWHEESELTRLAQELSIYIQQTFPAPIYLPLPSGRRCVLQVTVELARSLLEEPRHFLFNTFRKKGRPSNIRVESPSTVGCTAQGCLLPALGLLLKKGKCSVAGCVSNGTPLVYRNEQKIVDTMLTCDLIYLSSQELDFLLLVSSDDDFLPPIRIILLQRKNIIRIHPKTNNFRQPIVVGGMQLTELDIGN